MVRASLAVSAGEWFQWRRSRQAWLVEIKGMRGCHGKIEKYPLLASVSGRVEPLVTFTWVDSWEGWGQKPAPGGEARWRKASVGFGSFLLQGSVGVLGPEFKSPATWIIIVLVKHAESSVNAEFYQCWKFRNTSLPISQQEQHVGSL